MAGCTRPAEHQATRKPEHQNKLKTRAGHLGAKESRALEYKSSRKPGPGYQGTIKKKTRL